MFLLLTKPAPPQSRFLEILNVARFWGSALWRYASCSQRRRALLKISRTGQRGKSQRRRNFERSISFILTFHIHHITHQKKEGFGPGFERALGQMYVSAIDC